MDEKREFVRFRVSFPLKFIRDKLPSAVKGMVKDISMNGFKVILDKALKYLSEDLNSFHIILNEGKVLKLSGRVIWQRSYPDRIEAGIKFAGVSDYHKEDIYNYIFKHQRQELTEQWWQM